MRDPRVDPRPGDVLQSPYGYDQMEVVGSGGGIVVVRDNARRLYQIKTRNWSDWCEPLDVVRRAEDSA